MVDCKFCWHPYCEHAGEQRGFVVDCSNYTPLVKPEGKTIEFKRWRYTPEPTNADRIRAMSDEELAERMVGDVWDCCCCSEYDRIGGHPLLRNERCDEKCKEHCLDWLKQPARGGDNDG